MVNQRIKEKDLIKPVLRLIATHSDDYGGLDVTRIDMLLRKAMKLSEEDKQILQGRKDDRFSQVVRNLVSHRTLEKDGCAEYRRVRLYKRGAYFLTGKGAALLGCALPKRQKELFGEGAK